jgi:formylglycine-generating enzyme required for sulfatase activity
LEADGRVRLAPFGAQSGEEDDAFLAPELATVSPSPAGERSDVFSCAATLTALIDGRAPSRAGGLPSPIVAAGPGFRPETLQALAIARSADPADRPPSARALAALLFDFPAVAPCATAPSGAPPKPEPKTRQSQRGALWSALAALAALLIGGLYALDFSPPWRELPRRTPQVERAEAPAQSKRSPEPPIDPIAQRIADIASSIDRDALAAQTTEAEPIGGAATARLASLGYVLAKDGAAPLWLKPGGGEAFRDCADCPELVAIPRGEYLMGSPSNEPGRTDDEDDAPGPGGSPVAIKIAAPFAMSRREITRGEYAAFIAETKHATDGGCFARHGERTLDLGLSWRDPGFPQDDRHPVVCISYDDALAYAEWLSKRSGARYRLPTEAEYEYAARAGASARYFWGDDSVNLCSYANGADATAREQNPGWLVASCRDGFAFTAPVGSFRPNGFGLYDMIGNVWEWTSDCASDSLRQAAQGGPADCAAGANRILRGGSWSDPPDRLRLAARIAGPPEARDQIVGLRLVREIAR